MRGLLGDWPKYLELVYSGVDITLTTLRSSGWIDSYDGRRGTDWAGVNGSLLRRWRMVLFCSLPDFNRILSTCCNFVVFLRLLDCEKGTTILQNVSHC